MSLPQLPMPVPAAARSSRDLKVTGFTFDGSFPPGFLRPDEQVAATGNGAGHCVVTSPRGSTRIKPGDLVSRSRDGSLSTSTQPPGGCKHCDCVKGSEPCCRCEHAPQDHHQAEFRRHLREVEEEARAGR